LGLSHLPGQSRPKRRRWGNLGIMVDFEYEPPRLRPAIIVVH